MFQKLKGADILFYFVITYVMVAGGWWSFLLYVKNEDALSAKKQVLWHKFKEKGVTDETIYLNSEELKSLEEQYHRQRGMIFGESSVLLLLMVFGIWRIAKSRQKELAVAQQQRNFLLSITHELKSPIAVIKLTLDTFNKRSLTPEQAKMLTTNALADTERLNKLVEDLLLAARVDGGYQYVFEEIDLIELIEESKTICQSTFQGAIEFESDLEMAIINKGDKMMLSSVVLNLLENAIKYAPDSSKIVVKLTNNKDQQFCLEIADLGKGIPKTERENVFNKFYRIGNEDTRIAKGTGLGLYIVKQVILAHKGSISVRENVPQGSIFSVLLPIN